MEEEKIVKTISMAYHDLDVLISRKSAMRKTMLNYVNKENKFRLIDENISIGNNKYYLVFKLELI